MSHRDLWNEKFADREVKFTLGAGEYAALEVLVEQSNIENGNSQSVDEYVAWLIRRVIEVRIQ